MSKFSYHNFMFPFQWRIQEYGDKEFSDQISLANIRFATGSNWERQVVQEKESENDDLYNERNYFYEFVHDALYDTGDEGSLIRHFERIEPKHGNVEYVIDCGSKVYELKVNAINLNLYSTGVGVLSFYLSNEKYPEPADVMKINQAGRRVFPPFINSVKSRGIIANSIEIKGLHGRELGYREDFSRYTNKTGSNTPAAFLTDIILEIAQNIELRPVVDDRMFVQCWYKNDEWADEFKGDNYQEFVNSDKWYEFVFVDDLGGLSCQNKDMKQEIIKKATYLRWQKYSSLYGVSRYSMVYVTNMGCYDYLLNYFETEYARMAELILVQKASVLRFSSEVTRISNMDRRNNLSERVSSLYKEYIRFVNQIHFREISAQDQGIEMYNMLYDIMNIGMHVEKLEAEIGELYNYVSLREDRKGNHTMSLLTWIATIALPISVFAAVFGMNNVALNGGFNNYVLDHWYNSGTNQLVVLVMATLLTIVIAILIKDRRFKK